MWERSSSRPNQGYARLSDSVGASSRLGTSSGSSRPRASCRHPERLLDRYLRHRRARHDRVRVAVDQASDPVRILAYADSPDAHPGLALDQTYAHLLALERRASSGPMGLDGSPHDDGMMKPHNDAVLGDRHPGRDDGIRPQGHGWRIEGPHRSHCKKAYVPHYEQIVLRIDPRDRPQLDLVIVRGRHIYTSTRGPPHAASTPTLRHGSEEAPPQCEARLRRSTRIRSESSPWASRRNMVHEGWSSNVFRDGNVILLDDEDVILQPLTHATFAGRTLKRGAPYRFLLRPLTPTTWMRRR